MQSLLTELFFANSLRHFKMLSVVSDLSLKWVRKLERASSHFPVAVKTYGIPQKSRLRNCGADVALSSSVKTLCAYLSG